MPTFKIEVQTYQKLRDGKSPIVIRLTMHRQKVYLKSEYYASEKQLDKEGNIKDRWLLKQLNEKIDSYEDLIHKRIGNKIELYTAKDLKEFLTKASRTSASESIDFVEFSLSHIAKIQSAQKARARRLRTTLNSLIDFYGREKISITLITSKFLKDYESFLLSPRTITRNDQLGIARTTKREPITLSGVVDYMADVRTLFNAARKEFNDDDKDDILIYHYPFTRYQTPKVPAPIKRSLKIEIIRDIINTPDLEISGSHGINRANLARDCFALIFYFAGINTIDLFNVDKHLEGRLIYKRTKTKGRRQDEALISLKVESEAIPLIEKYRDKTGKRVFCFYQMYSNHSTFNAAVDKGLKHIMKHLSIAESISSYSARHSWATIARNDCGISKDDVHMALNHSDDRMKVTDAYIRKDWSILDSACREIMNYLNSDFTDGITWKEHKEMLKAEELRLKMEEAKKEKPGQNARAPIQTKN